MLRRLRRSRVVTVVLVGVTALVVGAGGVYWFGLRDDAAAVQTPEVTSQAVAASLTTLAAAEARLADSEDADDGSGASEAQIAANAAQVDVAQAAVDVAAAWATSTCAAF